MPRPRTKRVFPGERYGRGVVVREFSARKNGTLWWKAELRCDCGGTYETAIYDLLRDDSRATRSCGQCSGHGLARHDGAQHPLYGTWCNMMSRCYNPNLPQHKDWGGRGITACPRWHDPRLFIEDIERLIGPRPAGMSLDRIDNDGNYEPGNVRWASRAEQARNSRRYVDGSRSDYLYHVWWRIWRDYPALVCERWRELPAFRADVHRLLGDRPARMRFGRLDDTLPYEPGNIAWITGAQQIRRAREARGMV